MTAALRGCLCHRPEIQTLTRRIDADLSRRGFVAGAGAPRSRRSACLPSQGGGRAGAGAADRVHEFPAVRRQVRRVARRAPPARRGRPDQGRRGGQPAGAGWRAYDRLRRPGRHAGPDRRALAFRVRRAAALEPVRRGCRLHLSGRERRGRAHADARLHHGPRSRRSLLPAQAGDRRGHRAGPPHLSVRRDDHHHRRPWRLASAAGHAEESGRPAEPDGGNRRRDDRRQRGRGSPARARAAPAGRFADQARRRRRRVVAAHFARHDDIQRTRVARGGRSCRRLEHLCRGARLCAADRSSARSRRGRDASSTPISWTRRRRS